ncbi:MAG: hypothetical protein ACLTER_21065 [Ruminococcus sp.]
MSKDREFDKRKKFMMELLGDPVYQPMRFREIAGLLRLSKDEKKDLYRVLDDLVAEGKADLDSKGRYSKVTGRKRGKRSSVEKEKNVTRSFRVNVPGNMQKKAPRDVPGRKMRNIPIRNIMISRLESMITASPTIVTAGEKISTTIRNTADAARMMTRNFALPVWRTNIRTVHLWKAPSSVIPRALASWKSRGRQRRIYFGRLYRNGYAPG